jgi:PadR family transcriptional regulator, regulatory protein PadR
MTTSVSSDVLRGHTDTILLGFLREGDKYGYELSGLIFERSGRSYELKEATMYSSLRRLEAEGFITAYWGDESLGGRRKYYHITAAGVKAHDELLAEWSRARKILDRLMK